MAHFAGSEETGGDILALENPSEGKLGLGALQSLGNLTKSGEFLDSGFLFIS